MLFYIVMAGLLAFCFIDYKGKISYWLLIIMMFFLMAFQTWNADMTAYRGMFDSINSLNDLNVTDPAFSVLIYLSKLLHLEFADFRILITILGLILLTTIFRKYSVCPAIILALYFIFTYSAETIQLRAFLSESILYALIVRLVLEDEFNPKSYFVLLISAFLFHSFSLIFILLLLVERIKSRRFLLIISTVAGVLLSFSFEILSRFPVAAIRRRVLIYLDAQREVVSSKAWIFVFIFIAITIMLLLMEKYERDVLWKSKISKLIGVHYVGLVSCILIILFSSNFYRMTRTIIVSDFVIVFNYLFQSKKIDVKKLLLIAAATVVFFVGYEIFTQSWHRILSNNVALQFLQ